ncbi:MAG: bifunctional transaldolase/phosoglucose isomerase [Candidatus Aminicenantales bacterium]
MNPLRALQEYGQSFWLDYIRRSLITSGELERLVEEDGLRGLTSNLTIFQKAMAGSSDYDEAIKNLIHTDIHMDPWTLYEHLAFGDIQMTADVLHPVYEASEGGDGFVCIELPPELAYNSRESIREARRIWKALDRPNIMVKVPATPEGVPVIEALISDGINVNVTLMFSLAHYEAVAHAYLRGVARCPAPHRVASVASFFLSRMDRAVDKILEEMATSQAQSLRGKIAIANAKIVYQRFKKIFSGDDWRRLEKRGARVQRPLWASTGTRNPDYSDVLYVEELIGPHTVNTMLPATLTAFRDHGRVHPSLEEGIEEAEIAFHQLKSLGVEWEKVSDKLQADMVEAFTSSFDSLMKTLEEKRDTIIHGSRESQILSLGGYLSQVDQRLKSWKEKNFARRLWARDYTLWFPEKRAEITERLGWLVLPELMHERIEDFSDFARDIKEEGIAYVVLLGMGGSSLAAEVFQRTFGNAAGFPELIVLDSTHPSSVRSIVDRLDFSRTLFVVSSKSGTTLETLSFFHYFWNQASRRVGRAGRHFVAITDPGTPLMKLARERGFRRIFQAPSDVGGRYSALTDFGLLPAALIGMNIHRLLDRAWVASESNAFCVSEEEASGLILGASLGEIARNRDKLTLFTAEKLGSFPDWLEQLIAESTGKDGKGILPVVSEPMVSAELYGKDRFFLLFFLKEEKISRIEDLAQRLEREGHPVIRIILEDEYDIGREIFRWEMAVASAGSVLGIHPFNQPDVQLAKDLVEKAMEKREGGDFGNHEKMLSVEDSITLSLHLNRWMAEANANDYIALQAFLFPEEKTTEALHKVRLALLKRTRLATTLGFGPRFLHSTGQLHKGGPNKGLFLQLVDEPEEDVAVPEAGYTFGQLIRAQALGDLQALLQRGRRVLRINLKRDVLGGLGRLEELISSLQ